MDLTRPYADLLTGARGRVLAALVQLGTNATTVRDLASRSGTSPQGALDVVNDLTDAGIVATTTQGRSTVVTLNLEHLAARPLADLVGLRLALVERIKAHLADWPSILDAAWLYGSAARGEGDRSSDIDLLLVSADTDDLRWAEWTDALRELVGRWTGNPVELLEHDTESFAELVRSDNPLIASLRADGVALTPGARRRLRVAS